MKTIKIFLKQKEIETLCFSKIVKLPINQLSINKAKKYFAHAVEVLESKIIKKEKSFIILFSSVKKIEIPRTELNLFKNSFKIPLGLISLKDRKIYEEIGVITDLDEEYLPNLKTYSPFRRALTQLLIFGYEHTSTQKHIINFINNLYNTNNFSKLFIKTILNNKKYPQLEVKTSDIPNDAFFMYVWWAKYIIDHLLNCKSTDLNDVEIKKHKDWLKSFDLENLKKNHTPLKKVPELFKENSSMLIGYLFATQTHSLNDSKHVGNSIDQTLKGIRDVDSEYDILFWGIFFKSFFIEEIDSIFPNPLIQNNYYLMETKALSLGELISKKNESIDIIGFTYDNIDEKDLIHKYYELKVGHLKKSPEIITTDKIFKPFEDALLFRGNKNTVGFINMDFPNSISIDNEGFTSKGKFKPLMKTITYFGTLSKETISNLKKFGLNLKTKKLNTLIHKNKKVLVAFMTEKSPNGKIEKLYKNILKNPTNIKEMVVVYLTFTDPSELHSTEFALKKSEYSDFLEQEFDLKTSVIIKNLNQSDSSNYEVIKNLRIALNNYSVKEIEIIDNTNFTKERCEWIVEATKDYIIKAEGFDYYTLMSNR